MEYTNADVSVYQILDMLVSEYDYRIVNVPSSKNDIWIASMSDKSFPILRLTSQKSLSVGFDMEYLMRVRSAICMVINKEADVVILNTHEESGAYSSDHVNQILVRHDYISDSRLLKNFPLLEHALHKVEDNQSECARLTRHLENAQRQKMKAARKFSFRKAPKVTMVYIALCIVAFIGVQFLLTMSDNLIAGLVVSGAYYKAMVVHAGEFWRIFTAAFIHFDIITLLFYMVALYQVGKQCEKVYSKISYAAILVSSMVIGNIFAYICDSNVIVCGAGGALFGGVAALVMHIYVSKLYRNRLFRFQMSNLFFLLLIAFLVEASSFYSLLGGFVSGLFISILCYPSVSLKEYRLHFAICFLFMMAMLGYYSAQQYDAYPRNKEVDNAIVKEYRNLGFKDHADDLEKMFKKAYEE